MVEILSYCCMLVRWRYGRNLNCLIGLGLSTCVIQWRRKVCKSHYVSVQVLLNYLVTKDPVCNDGSQNKFFSLNYVYHSSEEPLAMGPSHDALPCCLDCMKPAKLGSVCPQCQMPVCEVLISAFLESAFCFLPAFWCNSCNVFCSSANISTN